VPCIGVFYNRTGSAAAIYHPSLLLRISLNNISLYDVFSSPFPFLQASRTSRYLTRGISCSFPRKYCWKISMQVSAKHQIWPIHPIFTWHRYERRYCITSLMHSFNSCAVWSVNYLDNIVSLATDSATQLPSVVFVRISTIRNRQLQPSISKRWQKLYTSPSGITNVQKNIEPH